MSKRSLHIRTAEDLFEALNSSDPGIRIPLLRAIAAAPEKALSYGCHGGRDLVGELSRQAYEIPDSDLKADLLAALSKFRDPRALNVFKRQIAVSGDPEAIRLAGTYLSLEPEENTKDILPGLLMQERSAFRAGVAARAMAGWKTPSAREAIRVAVYVPDAPPPPSIDEATRRHWLKELEGPQRGRARELLEAQGENAFLHMRGRWADLSTDLKAWLLEWGVRLHPAYAVELLISALEEGPDALRVASLQGISRMKEAKALFRQPASRFLKSEDPALRLAALRAGAMPEAWRQALEKEPDGNVRVELVRLLAEEKREEAAPVLLAALKDADPRVRAASADALAAVGRGVVGELRCLMDGPEAEVRAAAVQALLRLGDERWLEERMGTAKTQAPL